MQRIRLVALAAVVFCNVKLALIHEMLLEQGLAIL